MSDAVIGAAATGGVAVLLAFVRWAVTSAVRTTVNGQIKKVETKVDRVVAWTEDHDQTHKALLAALHRQGIERPDGL